MMMDWEIMWPKKMVMKGAFRRLHRGGSLPLKLEEAWALREAEADKVEDGGEGRRQMEMAGVMEALRVAGTQQKEGRWQGEEGVR